MQDKSKRFDNNQVYLNTKCFLIFFPNANLGLIWTDEQDKWTPPTKPHFGKANVISRGGHYDKNAISQWLKDYLTNENRDI